MKHKVYVNEPNLIGNEKKYLIKALKSGFISSSGPLVEEFEKKFAKKVDRRFAISVSNGTAALQLAIEAINLKKGCEVIIPSFTIISCLLPLLRLGLKPVFVDSNPLTWNLNVDELEKKINSKTKAIVVPHIYGLPVDMDPLLKIAKKYSLKVIEDAAEVIGLKYKNRPCGSFGDVSTFSFYANKHITTGEGGMITTNSLDIAKKCRSLRNICFNNKRRFSHNELGYNFRFTNIQAAVGLAQLEKLDKFVKKKRSIGIIYNEKIIDCDFILKPPNTNKYAHNIFWVYGLVLKKNSPINLENMIKKLKKKGIETRNFFWPLHQQPVLKKIGIKNKVKLPVSEHLARSGFYLPSGLSLTAKQQNYVISELNKIIKSVS
jgi:perosamine synthetase